MAAIYARQALDKLTLAADALIEATLHCPFSQSADRDDADYDATVSSRDDHVGLLTILNRLEPCTPLHHSRSVSRRQGTPHCTSKIGVTIGLAE